MEYTVQKLANIAGLSTRTLRYYDEIGLLKPARTSTSGYRIYGQAEVDQLQQILFYRELGVNLEVIQEIITNPAFDRIKALQRHREHRCQSEPHYEKPILRRIAQSMLGLTFRRISSTVAIADDGRGGPRYFGQIPNNEESIRKPFKKLSETECRPLCNPRFIRVMVAQKV